MSGARLRDWQTRLSDLLIERREMPHAWGTNDCCTFACDCVFAVCGYDPAKGLREHRTEAEAALTLEAHGGVRELGDLRLGARILPSQAAVGDIGMLVHLGRKSLAVFTGDRWVGPGPAGLERLTRDAARCAWRCERCQP